MTFGMIFLMSNLVALGAFLGRLAEPPERTSGALLKHLAFLLAAAAVIAIFVNRVRELWLS